ncbi:MAG: hypothetical protein ACMXYG_00125 [Candidatus Woesearchaeota archaeon]
MKIPNDKRLIIIEGIAGSGKSTFINILKNNFKNKKVYTFTEEELLMTWKHVFLNDINELRLNYLNKLIDFIELKLLEDNNTVFILERFHLTLKIFFIDDNKELLSMYNQLLSRITRLPVLILIPILKDSGINERSMHKERDLQWKEYLDNKLNNRGYDDLKKMYKDEQKLLMDLANKQGIPYKIIKAIRKC